MRSTNVANPHQRARPPIVPREYGIQRPTMSMKECPGIVHSKFLQPSADAQTTQYIAIPIVTATKSGNFETDC